MIMAHFRAFPRLVGGAGLCATSCSRPAQNRRGRKLFAAIPNAKISRLALCASYPILFWGCCRKMLSLFNRCLHCFPAYGKPSNFHH